jgi:hypothetical protein
MKTRMQTSLNLDENVESAVKRRAASALTSQVS